MSAVAFSGLASGLDTGSIVAQLVELKRAPIYRLEDRRKGFQNQLSSLVELKTKLIDMQKAMHDLDTAHEFSSLTASLNKEDFMTVSASSEAAAGTYEIKIDNLAKSQKDSSQSYDSVDDLVGSGIISFTINGETTDLNLGGNTTLEGLKDMVNNDIPGISATIINDGSGSGAYTLQLSSELEGTDNAFSVDVSGLSGGTTPLFTNSVPALDAQIEIDGTIITMGSNSSDDVISGLTLDLLKGSDGETIILKVNVDTEGISTKVKTFVDKYNDLFAYIKEQSGSEGALRKNPTLRSVARRIENLAVSSLSDGLGDISRFNEIGITRGDGRSLSFDEEDFKEALGDDFNGVRDFFIERDGNLGKGYLFDQAVENMTDSIDGLFKISNDALNKKIEYADQRIDRYEMSIESYRLTMERKFTAMELMVSQLQAQGSYLSSLNS